MSDQKQGVGNINNYFKLLSEPNMLFSVFLIVIVLMLIIPVPAFLLDFLMALNILAGLMIILTVSYIKKAIDFSIFPALLLTTTLFRLSVNVSSTRLILAKGVAFDGKMVRAFGQFVVGSNDASGMVIGIIIFAVLTLVQFIVITKGATRVAEVAARFSLDSMPNKYMAIDIDLQNGIIDEAGAVQRRQELQEESSFYGSMDGASKFIQGDVIVGIIITFINILGGFAVGMLVRGEDFNIALANYIPLTIGDGLISQIPSLLVSTATGLIVTRSQAKDSIGSVIWDQIRRQYRVFYIGGATLGIMAFLPGFPHIILFLISGGLIYSGYILQNASKKSTVSDMQKKDEKEEQKGPENVTGLLKVDPLSLYIGYELIPLVDKAKGAELLNSITSIRRTSALEMGIIVPPIRIQDNMRLEPNEYSFKIRGQEIGKGNIKIGYFLAMGEGAEPIDGEKTVEPAFGMPAVWIKEESREKAENLGFTVVDTPTIISTHIQELIKEHAFEILGREEVKQIIDTVKKDYPNIVDEVLADYKLAKIHKILQELLKENVPVRDMISIMETLTEHSSQTPLFELVEYIRASLKRAICNKYITDENKLHVLRFDPAVENEIYKNISYRDDGSVLLTVKPELLHKVQNAIKSKITEMFESGYAPVILCQAQVRRAISDVAKFINRNIAVVSTKEIVQNIEIILYGQISLEEKAAVK